MKKVTPGQYRRLTLIFAVLTLVALLLTGALRRSEAFLLRGIGGATDLPVRGGGARLGVNVALDPSDDAALQAALGELDSLGIREIKQSFFFTPDFDWTASDRILAAVDRFPTLRLTPLLDGDPADQFAPPDLEAFAAWAGAFAARYGDRVDAYIIWDEPNLASHWGGRPANPDVYGALLAGAAAAIRQADPGAFLVAAPLAPTVERGPANLADHLYLQKLYENGAASLVDALAGKPYGFDFPPDDRRVDPAVLNFSRAILLREVMTAHGDASKPLWAGNWGWNGLSAGWSGPPSIWGTVTETEKVAFAAAGYTRALREWPWMGPMFLQHWEPDAAADDPIQGFSLAGAPGLETLMAALPQPGLAYPGFHFASPADPSQTFRGGWEFSPEFGADASQVAEGDPPDTVTFRFWGTEAGLRVRRANYRARLYVLIDGRPANALPPDENSAAAGWGHALVLDTNDPESDTIATELVAKGLPAGEHLMAVTAFRGWDQFALQGFSAGYRPDLPHRNLQWLSGGLALVFGLLALGSARRGRWGESPAGRFLQTLDARRRWILTLVAAVIVGATGWLTWGEEAAGLYRRLGDGSQMAFILGAALIFYVTPWFWVYLAALVALFLLLTARPALGLALTAFAFPLYVQPVLKPIFSYRFSPVEIFLLVTLGAILTRAVLIWGRDGRGGRPPGRRAPVAADYAVLTFVAVATLSLGFTERLDVASNEWRLVVLEPALFYAGLRLAAPTKKEMRLMLDSLAAGAVLVAVIGLWQYATGANLITAEGGLLRLRAIYGSPNNVALYFGRIIPYLQAVVLLVPRPAGRWFPAFWEERRTALYTAALALLLAAFILTFSKGGLLLGLPAGVVTVFVIWQRSAGRRVWPWLAAAGAAGLLGYWLLLSVPALAGRLDVRSATGVFRLNLWQASLNMWRDHPWLGVGLDNFLYAYRGRYILVEAWQEPNLNHPHNILLDFATRLGLLGLLSGGWLIGSAFHLLGRAVRRMHQLGRPWWAIAAGFLGGLVQMVVHGLVDHSFFLVDLAFIFFLMLGVGVWLRENEGALGPAETAQFER